jgi:hypothetical protein
VAVPDASVTITGPTSTFTKTGTSQQPNVRTCCSKYGSTLFLRPQALAGMTLLRAGTLDDPSKITPSMSIYASRAHVWDQPNASIPSFPEMPPRAH